MVCTIEVRERRNQQRTVHRNKYLNSTTNRVVKARYSIGRAQEKCKNMKSSLKNKRKFKYFGPIASLLRWQLSPGLKQRCGALSLSLLLLVGRRLIFPHFEINLGEMKGKIHSLVCLFATHDHFVHSLDPV